MKPRLVENGLLYCNGCKKPVSVDRFHGAKNTVAKKMSRCSECGVWDRLARVYGMSKTAYESMMESQGGVCAICRSGPKYGHRMLTVDHCHSTGSVRGLLCGECNLAIGLFGEDVELLDMALAYVVRGGVP